MHTLPDPCVAPGAEVAPHCGPGWKLMRQGSPLASSSIQVQNGIDHFSDISCSWVSTWLGGWDERFEDGPFLLGQITGVAESFHCSTSSIFPFFFCFSIPLYTQPLRFQLSFPLSPSLCLKTSEKVLQKNVHQSTTRRTILPRVCPFAPCSYACRASERGSTVSTIGRMCPASINVPI